ncbi:flagellar basal body rod protein FlgB [Marinococcus luteus]|uniref:flagellar basal body rod protein FlgB n=1 Tax=Marinococcus luteus TaxID=1122204 RepID=UPI002ACCCEDE|nr:flagellar basal body rod protein FlgB [Marinococcus luteus]MDZ5781803.1 flagellar basal body rod protein FlgB [Marinococcus luteus]
MELFQSGAWQKLQAGVEGASLRQKAITDNIANIDTPNYKAKEVSFQDMLKEESSSQMEAVRTDAKHFSFQNNQNSPGVYEQKGNTYNNNGNNVDIDKEMTELSENQLHYNAIIDRINGKFGGIKSAIRGGS